MNVGPNPREGFWFSDGYGDYIRHFMAGLGSIPEWAPPDENHLVRSSSVVRSIDYADDSLSYVTFDAAAEDILRLAGPPERVEVGGEVVSEGEGDDEYELFDVATGGVVLVRLRSSGDSVSVTF